MSSAPSFATRAGKARALAAVMSSVIALIGVFAAIPASSAVALPPTANTNAATNLKSYAAVLNGVVNPGGAVVTACRFEYGTTAAYGRTAPCAPTASGIGSGGAGVSVTGELIQLEPSTTYHFRIVAGNATGTAEGNDRTFSTASPPADTCPNADIRRQQRIDLLDCIGLEMVSPPKKFSQAAEGASVNVDGTRVLFKSRGALEDPPGMSSLFAGDPYVATRGANGWSVTSALLPSQPTGDLIAPAGQEIVRSLSPDFSRWLSIASSAHQEQRGEATVFRAGLGVVFSPLSPLLVPVDLADRAGTNVSGGSFHGASADHSHVYFKPGNLATRYADDDPSPAGAEGNVYVAGLGADDAPSVELLARDHNGTEWGERCGARLGGQTTLFGGLTDGREQGAVSHDGSHVYFSTRPGQTDGVASCDTDANRLRIMQRVETPSGPEISQLIASECDRVSPACDGGDGDDLYQGASVDGDRVYFTTNRQLADSDVDGEGFGACSSFIATGCDLYQYDASRPAGSRLVQVSAGEVTASHPSVGSGADVATGTTAISSDGSHVYFVAAGVLTDDPNSEGAVALAGQRNLFVWNAEEQQLAFIGVLSNDDGTLWGSLGTFKNDAYPVPAAGTAPDGTQVGGDGHILVFLSRAQLTSDDLDSDQRDVFRYDASTHELVRVSTAAPGTPDNGSFDVVSRRLFDGSKSATDFAEHKRWASEDGKTIVFQTDEGLVADDRNGLFDDYLWRDGVVQRLPGTSRTEISLGSLSSLLAPALSHDGSSVAFEAFAQLLPEDGDVVGDVYVARIGGGFPAADARKECDVAAGDCQGAGSDVVSTDARTSPAAGSDNAAAESRKTLAVSVLSRKARARAARRGVLAIRLRSSSPGSVRVTASAKLGKKAARVARKTVRIPEAGAMTVSLRLNRAARKRLQAGKQLRVTIQARQPGARTRTSSVLLPGVRS